MVRTEQLGEAALTGDALLLRSLAQDWLWENPRIEHSAPPQSSDPAVIAVTTGLVELLAERRNQLAPKWTGDVEPMSQPIYLVKSAHVMPRLRRLCESESPSPLKRRNLFAPPTFLEFV